LVNKYRLIDIGRHFSKCSGILIIHSSHLVDYKYAKRKSVKTKGGRLATFLYLILTG